MRKLIHGLFLVFVVIAPVRQIKLDRIMELPQTLYGQGQELAQEGVSSSREELKSVICEQLEAYILVEAENLGAQIEVVSIALDEDTHVPVEIRLSGDPGPYQKQMLTAYLSGELGIGKERQIWNGGE